MLTTAQPVGQTIKELIQKYHYPRKAVGPAVAWNAFDEAVYRCEQTSGANTQGQACVSSSATTNGASSTTVSSSTTTNRASSTTVSTSATTSPTLIPAGAAPCPLLDKFNTLHCPDGEENEAVAVMGEKPLDGGDGLAYNLYSSCANAVTMTLHWGNGTAVSKRLASPLNSVDTIGYLDLCLFWSVENAK